MQSKLNRKDDGTIEITITAPWDRVKKDYDKIVDEAIKTVEVKGFRKGKAPRKIAEKNLDEEKVWQKTIEQTIPEYYSETIKKENLKPIMNPQIQLQKAAPENDLVFKITTAEQPEVELGDYKKAIDELKGKKTIWTPDAADPSPVNGDEPADRVSLNDIYEKLLEIVEIEVPAVLVDQQTNSELSRLIDETKKVGMTIEQYAQTKGITPKQLRGQKRQEAEQTLKLEMILEKIADEEKISVNDKEIEDYIDEVIKESKEKDKQKAKKNLKNQSYFIASLLRRKKTLRRLLS